MSCPLRHFRGAKAISTQVAEEAVKLGQRKAWDCQASTSVTFPLARTERSGAEALSFGAETDVVPTSGIVHRQLWGGMQRRVAGWVLSGRFCRH